MENINQIREAIDLLESVGGMVMLPPELDETIDRIVNKEEEKEKQKEITRLRRARKAADEALINGIKNGDSPIKSLTDIENCFLDEGLDIDEVEDWIHSHY